MPLISCTRYSIEGFGLASVKANEGVAAIALYLGITDIDDFLTGGGRADPPVPMYVAAKIINSIKIPIILYRMSGTFAITGLEDTTTSLLGCMNGSFKFEYYLVKCIIKFAFKKNHFLQIFLASSILNSTTSINGI